MQGKEFYELTHPQRNLLFMEQFNPGTSLGVIAGTVTLCDETIDIDILKKSINCLIKNNDGLRLRFSQVNGIPMQYVTEYSEVDIDFFDFSNSSAEDYFSWEERGARTPFEIFDNQLFYFAILKRNSEISFYMKLHHLISDGWTITLMANEIIDNYTKILNRKEDEIVEKPSYIDYIISEREYNNSARFKKSEDYWINKFENGFEAAKLKVKTSNAITTKACRKSYLLPEKLSKQLYEYVEKTGLSIFAIYTSIVAMYIYRVTGKESFNFGTLILNRANKKEKETIGMFINTIPVKVDINCNATLESFSKNVSKDMIGVLKNQKYPYDTLKKKLRERFGTEESLLDIILSYQNSKLFDNSIIKHKARWHFNGHQTHSLTIDINDRESTGQLVVSYDYLQSLFNEKEIEFLHDHITRLLWHALDNPQRSLGSLEMVSQAEKDKIMLDFNNTTCDYPQEKTLDMIFAEQVIKTPDKIALIDGERTLTYKELDEKSEKLAGILRRNGVKADEIVGIMMYRSVEMIVGILAIHKAGGAYMPIDPEYPNDRIEYMLENSQAKIILTHSMANKIVSNVSMINVSSEELDKVPYEKIERIHNHKNLAYVIYTSGSTGKPKGVMIEHTSTINRIIWMQKMYKLDENDIILQKTPYTFDVSVWELVWWYFVGAKVCMLEPHAQKYPDKIVEYIEKYKITTMHFVPSMLNAFLEYVDVSNTNNKLKSLKRVFASGEALTIEQVQKYNQLVYPVNSALLINLYGPTEATVDVSYFNCYPTPENKIIPIGKPIDNTHLYVLDSNLNILPIGIPGELYIAGVQLARGYVGNQKLTDERFIDNPFVKGEKMYKTGDLARWMPKGDIEYLGRIDFQIKIRGFRIEIGEIETQIKKFNDIKESVVIAIEDARNGLKSLCAYFVSNTKIDIKELKMFLASKLPDYMIPSYFMQLDEMPLSPNGKLDRKKLPQIDQTTEKIIIIEPATPEQKILVDVIKEVLTLKEIGINQNIFELGADSLKVIGILTKILKYKLDINVQDFYQYPTIELLSKKITNSITEDCDFPPKDLAVVYNFEDVKNISYQKLNSKNVFLTGATGFLGIHILQNLIENTNSNVYCLVRAENLQLSLERLKDCLHFHFNGKYIDLIDKRIFVINGNISKKYFGLAKEIYEELGKKINIIINCAAMVKYYGQYDIIEKVNVFGTQNVIDFALKYDIKLNHISTVSITGDYLVNNNLAKSTFSERDFYVGQRYWENIYVRSKFEAENLVLKAGNNGLKYSIYRMGNLTGRHVDGHFQINIADNAFYSALKTIIQLGYVSESLANEKIEFTPIDLAADAIVKSFDTIESANRVFHISNNNLIAIKDLITILSKIGINLKILSESEINKLDITPDLDNVSQIYIDEKGNLINDVTFTLNSDLTCNYLNLIGFAWNKIDIDYIEKIINYMKDKNYIKI